MTPPPSPAPPRPPCRHAPPPQPPAPHHVRAPAHRAPQAPDCLLLLAPLPQLIPTPADGDHPMRPRDLRPIHPRHLGPIQVGRLDLVRLHQLLPIVADRDHL